MSILQALTAEVVASELKEARDRIESGWTQNVSARDKNDNFCQPTSEEAVKWCTIGAIAGRSSMPTVAHLSWVLIHQYRTGPFTRYSFTRYSLAGFNDDPCTTQEDVLALYDLAIETPVRGDYEDLICYTTGVTQEGASDNP